MFRVLCYVLSGLAGLVCGALTGLIIGTVMVALTALLLQDFAFDRSSATALLMSMLGYGIIFAELILAEVHELFTFDA